MSESLWPHRLQHTRPPCPSPTPRTFSNTCPSSQWCHPTTSSSVIPFSSCPQSFPPSGSFPMSRLFSSDGQRIGVSASASVNSAAYLHPTLCGPWTTAGQASLSITNSQSLLKLMSIELVMPSNHLILCCPLLFLPSIFLFHRGLFQWVSYWHQVAKVLEFISPSSEYSGLIFFRIDWLDFLAVQGTLKRLLQHHSSKASILCCSAFFIV